jgi:hypothetical protein
MRVGILVTNFFYHSGAPRGLHINQGQYIKSQFLQEVLQCLRLCNMQITPLHPQMESMVDWYVTTVEENLKKVILMHHRDWKGRLHSSSWPTNHPLTRPQEVSLSAWWSGGSSICLVTCYLEVPREGNLWHPTFCLLKSECGNWVNTWYDHVANRRILGRERNLTVPPD